MLPLGLHTLYTKLHLFAQSYPQAGLSVEIQGDFQRVDSCYERYRTKLMFNKKYSPAQERRVTRPAAEEVQEVTRKSALVPQFTFGPA